VDVHVPGGVRLQKVLADAGFGSRRKAEQLIEDGRVSVDGQIVIELGVRVDPAKNAIHVDGMRVLLDSSKVTVAVNKPVGVISAMSDAQGRPTLAELVRNREERLFHVGRLDLDSEGLILLTNDGELGNRLAHPRYEVPKTYLATVSGGEVYPRMIRQLLDGVDLEDGRATMDKVKIVQALGDVTMVEVVLHDGRNRIVRRMFDAVGRPVERLVRTRIGPIALGDQRPGTNRVLSKTEVGSLMAAVDL
jgi:23S rRNA pseudouridine2605 synthase